MAALYWHDYALVNRLYTLIHLNHRDIFGPTSDANIKPEIVRDE